MQPRTESRFYCPPTEEQIIEHGPFIAETLCRIKAERTTSRIFSGAMALIAGTTLSIIEVSTSGFENPKQIIGNFLVPSLVNLIGQSRTERTQKREVTHIIEVVDKVREQHQLEVATTEAYIDSLTIKLEQYEINVPPRISPELSS